MRMYVRAWDVGEKGHTGRDCAGTYACRTSIVTTKKSSGPAPVITFFFLCIIC
jgi:hypothetical protein